jgi:serine/threonine-protein kinase
MAPEYLAGRIDPRADLFAVGVIAHELLTNRPLFSGRDDIATLTRVRDMHIDPPSKKNPLVPPEIDDVVMTALARDPERRWQHATALRSALTTLTRRLGLVASNAQLIEWLDWAFTQKRPARPRSEPDTETDGEPLVEEPSISVQQPTVNLSAKSQQITLRRNDGRRDAPEPPSKAPVGTPAYVPAQHPLPAQADRSGPVAAPVARASTSIPARAPSGTAPPPGRLPSAVHPVVRPSSPSQPPPLAHPAMPRAASPSQPPPLVAQPSRSVSPSQPLPLATQPQPSRAASQPPLAGSPSQPPLAALGIRPSRTLPVAAAPMPRAASPSQPPLLTQLALGGPPVAMPAIPARNAAPMGAPRPSLPAYDPAVAPPPGPRSDRISGRRPGRTGRYGPLAAASLVVLAAAAAATTVYFVLHLLT